jgi:hypothetical protein
MNNIRATTMKSYKNQCNLQSSPPQYLYYPHSNENDLSLSKNLAFNQKFIYSEVDL